MDLDLDQIALALPLPWQEQLWQRFNQRLEQGRLPHGVMLSGPSGIGVERLATAFSQRLLCNAEMSKYACGSCKGCKLLMAGTHPDLSILEPADVGKGILIDSVRNLTARLGKTAQQGGWKVALISPAEAMNESSCNALLKSLEEPQSKTLLILVSHRASLVPATIRSRCQIDHLSVPDLQVARQWLIEVAGEQQAVDQSLELAGGKPLLALEYMQSDSIEQRHMFEQLVDNIRLGDLSPMSAAQQVQKLNSDQMLDWFMHYLHRLVTGEMQNSLNPALFEFGDQLRKARGWALSGSNINPQLMWEGLFMDWLKVFRSPR
jgi:DNA polymerase-3 subunit delta'